jgi:hypothetical protein
MNKNQYSALRKGNKALDFIFNKFSPINNKLQIVIDSLPKFADILYYEAQFLAKSLLKNRATNRIAPLIKRILGPFAFSMAKRVLLANCILDLNMTVFFEEMMKYLNNNELASLLVDAMVYQATGLEVSIPTKNDFLDNKTQNSRGIRKFQIAHKVSPHIEDIEAWVFGLEYSVIISGRPENFVRVLSIDGFSLFSRFHAKWGIRSILYGESPTEEDEKSLEELSNKRARKWEEMSMKFINSIKV